MAAFPLSQPFAPFFEGLRNIVHLFYNKGITTDTNSVDFSFLIATIIFLLTALAIKFAIEFIEIFERKYELLQDSQRLRAEKRFNEELEREYLETEVKNNKIIVLIELTSSSASRGNLYNKEQPEDAEKKTKEILFELFEILDEDINCKKEIFNNGILLYYDNYSSIDTFITLLRSILKGLKNKYYEDKWIIKYACSIDVYADRAEVETKKEVLKKLVRIKAEDKIVCLSNFMHRYSLVKNPKFSFSTEGFYKIKENEEVFSLEDLK